MNSFQLPAGEKGSWHGPDLKEILEYARIAF